MFERVLNTQKQPPEVFFKNSQNSHEKHMCQSLFIKKHEGLIKNETPTQVVSCEFCKIFKNTYFEENLRTATSAVNYFRKKFHFFMLDSVLNTPFQPATFFRILLILIITLRVFTDPYSPVQGQNLRFYPYTGEYGSVKACILAYFMQCQVLKQICNE